MGSPNDDNGNRTEFDDVEHGTTTLGTYDAQDRMLTYGTLAYTYTADGALKTKTDTATGAVTSYAYDALGNLIRVDLPDGRVIEYVIDGMGRRVGKKINGVPSDGWAYRPEPNTTFASRRLGASLDGSGNLRARIVQGTPESAPDVMLVSGRAYRVVKDQIGSVRLIVDAVDGTVARRIESPSNRQFHSGGRRRRPSTHRGWACGGLLLRVTLAAKCVVSLLPLRPSFCAAYKAASIRVQIA